MNKQRKKNIKLVIPNQKDLRACDPRACDCNVGGQFYLLQGSGSVQQQQHLFPPEPKITIAYIHRALLLGPMTGVLTASGTLPGTR